MSDSHAEQARAILAYERHIQELAKAEMERVYQMHGSTIRSTADASTPAAPGKAGKAGKSALEQALDAYEARTSGLDHILGSPPSPAPKAAPTGPQGPAKGILDAVMDRHEARKVYPC